MGSKPSHARRACLTASKCSTRGCALGVDDHAELVAERRGERLGVARGQPQRIGATGEVLGERVGPPPCGRVDAHADLERPRVAARAADVRCGTGPPGVGAALGVERLDREPLGRARDELVERCTGQVLVDPGAPLGKISHTTHMLRRYWPPTS